MNQPEKDPPSQTSPESQELELAKLAAHQALDAAEKAWHAYASMCDVGPERIRAFEIFENVRTARNVYLVR